MQRQRGELVPIGDALADLGGLVQALRETPPPVKGGVNLDHFGGAKVDQLVKGQRFSWDGWNGACGRPLGRPRRSGGARRSA